MPFISWIKASERVVGRDSPNYDDVDNRPLRQIVQLTGWDPDDPSFEGLHHFPLGVFTDSISEETAGAGIDFLSVSKFHTASGTGIIVPFDGIFQWADAGEATIGTVEKLIDRGETGWTAGTGTQTRGGLDTATATVAQVAAVVNALVNTLMNHHKLIRT